MLVGIQRTEDAQGNHVLVRAITFKSAYGNRMRLWKREGTHLSRHVSGQKLVSARTREGMSLLHWRRSWYCLILESAPVLPYPAIASYSFSDKSHVAFRTYADSCGSGSDALWPVTAGSILPLSTNRRGMVGAETKAGCRYADADMLLMDFRVSQPSLRDKKSGTVTFRSNICPRALWKSPSDTCSY